MKLKLMILKNNKITGESNEDDSWEKISEKVKEEYLELQEAIKEGDRPHIAEEAFDVQQMIIRIMALLEKENLDLEQLGKRHNRKLVKRGWTHSKIIRIFWDK
ncbi:MazG nucleotide pyrophosphohydrolase domain-containing protein [Clostridium gasigenes]|uniref:MazG nucleotide pyrophosphohydrolase domain-containing protein n=1 Tax=Clostridium gasigenes TaxID=94869 RepID=UPI001C0D443D|nr:MazG nucleotide pyrophosphohydrolase domain-containing protein [Clostridium gasigenes]MBU3102956.1 hypothetical protein [Clostridium gasigenes]